MVIIVIQSFRRMNCPRCIQRIHRAAETCPHCGFTIADVDLKYGVAGTKLRCLTDHAGILRRGDRERLESVLRRFTHRFPQLFVALYTGPLGELSEMRQFGFWLLNRAVFEDIPSDRSNDAGILLMVDPNSKSAGIVFGYLLDAYLDESDTFDCLARAHGHWLEQRYVAGLLRVFDHLEHVLIKRSRKASRNPKAYQKIVAPQALPAMDAEAAKDGREEVAP